MPPRFLSKIANALHPPADPDVVQVQGNDGAPVYVDRRTGEVVPDDNAKAGQFPGRDAGFDYPHHNNETPDAGFQPSQGPKYSVPAVASKTESSPTARKVLDEQRTGPVYTPANITANPSALIKRPTAPTYKEPAAPSGPMVVYGSKGQPQGVEGGGTDMEKQAAYLHALEMYKPENHNSRLKSIGLGAARALTRGGSPIGGALEAAIDPAMDERFANDREIARVSRPLNAEAARQKVAAETAYKNAQADHELHPTYAPHYENTDEGIVGIQGNVASPVYDPSGKRAKASVKPGTEKTEIRHNPVTGKAEKWALGSAGQPDKKVEDWTDSAKDLVKVNGHWVPQATAVTADALSGQRTYQRGRDVIEDKRRDEEKTQTQLEKIQTRRKEAGDVAGKLDTAREAWIQADAKAAKLKERLAAETDPDRKQTIQDQIDNWEYQKSKAQSEAAGHASTLSKSYGDMYEAGPGEGGLAYYKQKPLSISNWRTKYPKASKQQQAAWEQNAKDSGFEVGP